MKRNEKLLAGALVIMVVGYFAWPMADSIFFAPILEGEEKVAMYGKQRDDKNAEYTQLRVAEKRVADWTAQGLPGDPLNAQRLYQQWLTDLANASQLDAQPQAGLRRGVGNIFTAVQVTLKGDAKFSELQTFLQRFNQVDLLHRITVLDIDNVPSAEGDPELPFQLTAEAVNVRGAPERSRLFPQIELAEPLAAGSTTLPVAKKAFSAKPGDLVRLGGEFVAVVEANDDHLKIQRGTFGSSASEHPKGTTAELFPLKRDKPDSFAAFAEMSNPFVKPRRYDPQFDGLTDQKFVRGNVMKLPVKVVDYDRSAGPPKIEVTEGPPGIEFDPATGELIWAPSAETQPGTHQITVAAEIPSPQKRLVKTVQVSFSEPNTPPRFDPVPASEVFLGETLRLPLKVVDPDGSGSLSYKVEEGPEGASVDAGKGEFTWSVPQSFNPGEVTVTVTATDQGEPALSAKQTFNIKVHENLKPFVKLVSTIDDGVRSAWLWNQAEGRRVTLSEGKSFEVAGLKAVTKEIGGRYVVYERNGEVWRLGLGDSLEQAEKTGSVPVSSDLAPVEAPQPDAPAPADSPSPTTAGVESSAL